MSRFVAIALLLAQAPALAQPPPAAPPSVPEGVEPPAPTRATFVSTGGLPWDVVVDGEPVCATPCTGPLQPLQFVTQACP